MQPPPTLRREIFDLGKLAVPITAAQLGQMLLGVADLFVLGRRSELDLAAVGLGGTLFFSASILGLGFALGLDPLIAQALGRAEPREARRYWVQGLWLAFFAGLPLTLLGLALGKALPRLGVQADVAARTLEFLVFRLPSVVPFLAFLATRSLLQASGATRPLLLGAAVANVVNLPLCALLVFGDAGLSRLGLPAPGVPELGIAGAGIANTVATLLQLGVAVYAARALAGESGADRRAPDLARLWRIVRLGLPIGLTQGAEHGVFAIATVLMGGLGATALAGHNVAMTLAAAAFMVPLGLGAAAAVRVGRAVGAGDGTGARRAGFTAILVGVVFELGSMGVFLGFAEPLARLVTSESSAIAAAVPLIFIAALFQMSDGVQAIAAGALRGAGDTRAPLLANLAGHYLVGLPLAVLLAFPLGWGAVGIWWGLSGGLAVVALALTVRFCRLSRRAIQPV